jgi:hypothetical protein
MPDHHGKGIKNMPLHHPNPNRYIYAYRIPASEDYWLFAGNGYGRVREVDDRLRLVRLQGSLPAGAVGACLEIDPTGQRQLEREARRSGVRFSVYASSQDCLRAALEEGHPQYVFGLTQPAGQWSLREEIDGRD